MTTQPSNATSSSPRRILKLEESVINRIAAGEIIQRPANAIKELIENAIDAQTTAIDLVVGNGGLNLLQITDNGCGIQLEDMPILCERFTTSKIREFNDLTKIDTYGFRGEALASITHVARVTVTTKTANSLCAYKATYADGRLVPPRSGMSSEPKPTAGNQGTQITVEGMFDNIPSRKRALNKPNEEYSRILDVVNRYAIHCAGVAFSCKKAGENLTSLSTASRNSAVDNIRLIYGSSVANELLSIEADESQSGFRFNGLLTSANYHVKKFTHVIFINNRLVESTVIKKCIENVYGRILPKEQHPFAYISLHVDAARIDVNVHPTKREVSLLDEEAILISISSTMSERLCQGEHSRSFVTQSILPATVYEGGNSAARLKKVAVLESQSPAFVRTDSKQQKLSTMLEKAEASNTNSRINSITSHPDGQIRETAKERVSIQLASVKELRSEVKKNMHEDLTALFTEHVFVGIATLADRLAIVQHLTKLYLIDYGAVSAELFYQIGLSEFGNFGTIVLKPALKLRALLDIALDDKLKQVGLTETERESFASLNINESCTKLIDRREMLNEYFAIKFSATGELETIPLLLRNYKPAITKLPNFLLNLVMNVNWNSEKECFRTFLWQLALFYVPEVFKEAIIAPESGRMSRSDDRLDVPRARPLISAEEANLRSAIEDILFPNFKKRLIATKDLASKKSITQIGELSQLYKVFERC